MNRTTTLLNRRTWRRLERSALRGHDRDLHSHLSELTETGPTVLNTDTSWTGGVVALQLPRHRLVLGGVTASMAWDILAMSFSAAPLTLRKSGRYGRYWWIEIAGEETRVVLATHLQLHHDPGRAQEIEMDLPVLSGAY
jgi:hypothetical protein